MAFQKGAKNVVSIQKARIAELEAELQGVKMYQHINGFTDSMLRNIGVILALTPYEQWPAIAKAAYKHAAERQPTTAQYYKQNLPTK